MIQLTLGDGMRKKVPTSKQGHKLLVMLAGGATLTPVKALQEGIGFRLSERIREIEKMGYEIERGWFKTAGGARVRTYRLK